MTGHLRLLVAAYPRAWRRRYGAELADLVAAMAADGTPRDRGRLALDLVRGALDAHRHWRPDPKPARRRGAPAGRRPHCQVTT